MSVSTKSLDRYYPDSHKRFLNDTADHVMQIEHDDGLYRHVRFKAPGTSMYWYELITWPGSIVVNGDMGSFGFSRVEDMFDFFAEGYINPGYWAQKLHNREGIKDWSETLAKKAVQEMWDQGAGRFDHATKVKIYAAIREEVLPYVGCRWEAGETFRDFDVEGFRFDEWYEHTLEDYTIQFLWCCHAIREGIRQYKAATS